MALHFFIQGTPRQLQLMEYGLDIALVPGQCRAQALRLKGFLLCHQRLPRVGLGQLRFAQPQHIPLGHVGQFAHVAGPGVAEQTRQLRAAQHL